MHNPCLNIIYAKFIPNEMLVTQINDGYNKLVLYTPSQYALLPKIGKLNNAVRPTLIPVTPNKNFYT